MCHNEFRLAKLAPGRRLRRLGWVGAFLVALGLWLGPLVHGRSADRGGIEIVDGWVRVLPGDLPCSGYFVVRNGGDEPAELTGATTTAFAEVQMHESYTAAGGGSGMRQVRAVTVPAHGEVRFAPGGYHLMLMDRTRAIHPGDKIEVTFSFRDGRTCAAALTAKPANFEAPR